MAIEVLDLDVTQFIDEEDHDIAKAVSELLQEGVSGWEGKQKKGIEEVAKSLAQTVDRTIDRYQNGEIDEDWAERVLLAARNAFDALILEEKFVEKAARRRIRRIVFKLVGAAVGRWIGVDLLELFQVPSD